MNLQGECNKCAHQNVFLYFFWQLHLLARPLCQSADKHLAGKRKDDSDSCRTDKSRFNHCKCLQNKQLQMLTDDKSSLEEAAQPCGRAPPNGQRWDSSGVLGELREGSHVAERDCNVQENKVKISIWFTVIFGLLNNETFLMETWMAATIVKQLSHHLRHYDFIIFKIKKKKVGTCSTMKINYPQLQF